VSRSSAVGTAAGCGFGFRVLVGSRIVIYPNCADCFWTPPPQPPIQGSPGVLSQTVKWETDVSPPASAKVKKI
jgi:hypothetical protein